MLRERSMRRGVAAELGRRGRRLPPDAGRIARCRKGALIACLLAGAILASGAGLTAAAAAPRNTNSHARHRPVFVPSCPRSDVPISEAATCAASDQREQAESLFPVSRGARERPFHGRIEGSFITTPTLDPTVILAEATAVGEGAHIGSFRKVTNDAINLAILEVDGIFTMTAANGDVIEGCYSGLFEFGTSPGTLSWVLEAAITGGTGQFAGATGEFIFIADVEYVGANGKFYGEYTETFDGVISY